MYVWRPWCVFFFRNLMMWTAIWIPRSVEHYKMGLARITLYFYRPVYFNSCALSTFLKWEGVDSLPCNSQEVIQESHMLFWLFGTNRNWWRTSCPRRARLGQLFDRFWYPNRIYFEGWLNLGTTYILRDFAAIRSRLGETKFSGIFLRADDTSDNSDSAKKVGVAL